MDTVSNEACANTAKTKLATNDLLDIAVMGIGTLASRINAVVGEVPYAVAVQIASVTEYLDMLAAQPEISTEREAYQYGVAIGALITISAHLRALGYVEQTTSANAVVPASKKEKQSKNLK